jgi:hypothetical protein
MIVLRDEYRRLQLPWWSARGSGACCGTETQEQSPAEREQKEAAFIHAVTFVYSRGQALPTIISKPGMSPLPSNLLHYVIIPHATT